MARPGGRRLPDTPGDLRYSDSHEWVRVEDDVAIIGITDYAQDSLTDVVFVELPKVGDEFDVGDAFGVVESVKSVSELYSPVAGRVVAVNEALEDQPEKVNEDPYGEGWMVRIEMSDATGLDALMDAGAYVKMTEGGAPAEEE